MHYRMPLILFVSACSQTATEDRRAPESKAEASSIVEDPRERLIIEAQRGVRQVVSSGFEIEFRPRISVMTEVGVVCGYVKLRNRNEEVSSEIPYYYSRATGAALDDGTERVSVRESCSGVFDIDL